MKKLTLIILLTFATCFTFAQVKQTVTKASVTYQVKNMGFITSGMFTGITANILFDKAHLASSSIEASVDTKTINSDDDMRDEHLRKDDFFDVGHYPKMVMRSVSFQQKSGNNYIGQFDLTIKGKTKRVELPFNYVQTGATSIFKGSFKINRLDFGVGTSSMVLANDITVSINIETVVAAT